MATASVVGKSVKKPAKRAKGKAVPSEERSFTQRIEEKAYDLYVKRGFEPGHEWEDWFEAQQLVERELMAGH